MDSLEIFLSGFLSGSIIFIVITYLIASRFHKMNIFRNRDIIKSISMDVLREATDQNIKVSENVLKNVTTNTAGVLEEKKAELKSIIDPLRMELDNYRKGIENMENIRREDYGNIKQFLHSLGEITSKIRDETISMNQMLKNSQSRGRWGEITLRRIVESAGLVEHIDFDQQVHIDSGERPDMVVHLPGNKEVIVDSKAPYKKFMESCEVEDQEQREKILKEYAFDLRRQIKNLSSKDYSGKIKFSYEFIVMFLPQENMLQSAMSYDQELVDYAISNKIVMATPLTLFALLKVIQMSWKEDSMIRNSGNLVKLSGIVYERISGMYERINKTGKDINTLIRDYNSLVSFSESRVLPSLKKMNQIGELSRTDVEISFEVDEYVREPAEEKWKAEEDKS